MYRGDDGVYVNGTRYTLGEISRGSGVSRPHVTRIFSGKRNMSIEVAQRISAFLGVPLEELVEYMKRERERGRGLGD
jgi:transcriptional regulator with XRE-family HTH domain